MVNTKQLIKCEVCEAVADYTIQPVNSILISYWCEKHFNETVKDFK